MQRINDEMLGCVFYLYPTKEDADNGVKSGGTGFWVSVASVVPGYRHVYAVTCKHVVKPVGKEPAPVIRLNTFDGEFDTIPRTTDDWICYEEMFPEEKRDLAILDAGEIYENHRVTFIKAERLLTDRHIMENNIGAGDDVTMIGRYIDHDGLQRNTPSVRFGKLSMMPGEALRNEEGFNEESFIVEMRSLAGYSGLPVFVDKPRFRVEGDKIVPGYDTWLMGVLWSQPPHAEFHEEIDRYVEVWSGMSNVIPAWHIARMLEWEAFKMNRKQKDKKYAKESARVTQVSTGATRNQGQFTRDDFMRDLNKVVKKKGDSGKGEKDENKTV